MVAVGVGVGVSSGTALAAAGRAVQIATQAIMATAKIKVSFHIIHLQYLFPAYFAI